MIPEKSVIQYVRNKKRRPMGVLVALKDSNSPEGFRIGYSLCNKKDRFSKHMGLVVAIGRADVAVTEYGLPRDIAGLLPEFKARCRKYYKT